MQYKKDSNGKIIQCTRQILTGSIVLPNLKPGDFVLIKNAKKLDIPYGIYGGIVHTKALVRTYQYDILVEPKYVIHITPSEPLINNLIEKIINLQDVKLEPKHYKFYMSYLYWKYPNKIGNIVRRCVKCGTLFPSIYINNNDMVCSCCYNAYYATCERCYKIIPKSEMVDKRCKSCAKYHYITPYHTGTPKIAFYGKNTPYMGVEIEVDNGGKDNNIVSHIMELFNQDDKILCYCSSDSTLLNGFEIITQPMGLSQHYELYSRYKAMFEYLQKHGYLADNLTNCGLHIHIDRKYFKNKEQVLYNILYLHEKLYNDIMTFSRRDMLYLGHCSKFAKPIDYVIKYANMDRTMRNTYHKCYIDITGKATIEFRYFQSTLNVDYLFAALQLTHNIVNYCMNHSKRNIASLSFVDLLDTPSLRKYWKEVNEDAN